jgi:hypothetical protein
MLKRQIPLAIAFIMGVLFIIQFFVPHQWSQNMQIWVGDWYIIIGGISFLLGIGSLIHFHYIQIARLSPGWGFSVVLFISLIGAILAGFLPSIFPGFIQSIGLPSVQGMEDGSPLDWIFRHGLTPLSATMFSIIGFFIASASFRAFRARSVEATLLLLAAVIIMLGQTPIGQMLWQGIPDIMVWIFNVPTTAAKRAILFGIAMGSIAFSLRIIFGIERAYLGGKD